jgi:tripartite-type tricarboxylate transporter receptor subunit TctC
MSESLGQPIVIQNRGDAGSTIGTRDVSQVALMFCPMASVVGQVRAGSLRAIAVTGVKRSPLFPDLPTVAEAGLPGYAAELHYGLVAPAGTPTEVIAKLNCALNNALSDANVRSRLPPTAPKRCRARQIPMRPPMSPVRKSNGVLLLRRLG